MNDFTILHLSDLHFNKKGKQLPDLMVNLLSDIKEQLKYINNLIIVVTGDLVHRGNYEYKNSVLTFFEKLSDIVGSKAKDIYIIPGNHDKVRNCAFCTLWRSQMRFRAVALRSITAARF